MEAEWVKLCPYLGVVPPHPLVANQDQTAKDVIEIYDYFKENFPDDPFKGFVKHYTTLAKTPINENKITQMKNSINLFKVLKQAKLLQRRTEKQLRDSGIKLK